MATQSLAPYKKPAPMKKDVSNRDITKFCHFHGDYGHDTNECNNLKREIEFLIRKNNRHVQKYVKVNQNQRGDNNQDVLPPPVDGHLQVIIGGSHIARDSGKARERYARTVQHEQEEVVLAIEGRKSKIPRAWEPTITFNDEDTVKIRFSHNDPLVVEIQIANKMVARTMIDNRASSNILFKTTYEKMGLQLKDLTPVFSPCSSPFYRTKMTPTRPLDFNINTPKTFGLSNKSILNKTLGLHNESSIMKTF
ncbi:uncharacterized protein LOC133032118 [Cannabis sativa]|uniref:uncharacterized protein LOC133032118 n=1 Tax=Cannabis sativa TaxID=3483 RepID=UPI0029CA56E4|nr:uncharacterized protein LOC133032118 [Cannabis sativa]